MLKKTYLRSGFIAEQKKLYEEAVDPLEFDYNHMRNSKWEFSGRDRERGTYTWTDDRDYIHIKFHPNGTISTQYEETSSYGKPSNFDIEVHHKNSSDASKYIRQYYKSGY